MNDAPFDEESAFHGARGIENAARRAAYLQQICPDKAARARIEALLRVHDREPEFMSSPARLTDASDMDHGPASSTPVESADGAEPSETEIGPYKLRERIGEGGFGVVYVAEQSKPVQRRVALKLVKPGMDTREIVSRFEAERQALALMDHPNIARVLDAGSTPRGRPYFAMELVRGFPITDFCDQNRLSARDRLSLFIDICHAVQHAHQKGIIHRDLKPSNVMITMHDDRPVVKVIDFGVAKALDRPLTENTVYTAYGQVIGTPLYMSPEQARMSGLDVDTRCDIYSLGVLLYELLTGTTPFRKETLQQVGLVELRRMICENEPPQPSVRVGTLEAEVLSTIADRRRIDPRKLRKSLSGELDWIVMKCLEVDRARRYQTAGELARDAQRYLAFEPVHAGPPTAWYRVQKFIHRRRRALVMTSVAALTLLAAAAAVAGSLGWAYMDRHARSAVVDAGVEQALREGRGHMAARQWSEARVALDRAEGLLLGGSEHPPLAREAAELRADLEVVEQMQRLRMTTPGRIENASGHFVDFRQTDTAYAETFRRLGVEPLTMAPELAARRIQHRSAVREFALSLDDWAAIQRNLGGDEQSGNLLALARLLDPDPLRNALRDAVEHRDGAALDRLAETKEAGNWPPITVLLLCRALTEQYQFDKTRDWRERTRLAARLLTETQHNHPDDFWINYLLAQQMLNLNQPHEATRYITAAAAARGDNDLVYFKYGQILLASEGKQHEAAWALRKAIAYQPDSVWAHRFLGDALEKSDDLDGAIQAFERAASLDPEAPPIQLAAAYHKKRAIREAAAAYDLALRKVPLNNRNTISNMVDAFLSDVVLSPTSSPEALRAVVPLAEHQTRITPHNSNFWLRLGIALYRLEQWDSAVEALRSAGHKARFPVIYEPPFYEALALAGAGRITEGQAAFQRGVANVERSRASNREITPLCAEAAEKVWQPFPITLRDPETGIALNAPPAPQSPPRDAVVRGQDSGQGQNAGNAKAGASGGGNSISYRWTPVAGATRYHLQIRGATDNGSLMVDSCAITGPSFLQRIAVPPRRSSPLRLGYAWRVRALLDDQWTAWSDWSPVWFELPATEDTSPRS